MVGEGSGAGLTDAEVMLGAVTDRAIVMLDSDGGIIRWSAGAQALLGYSDQEVTGKPISIFHSADDRAAGLATRELAQAREHHRVEFEGWRVRKGGHHFRANVAVSAVRDESGSLTGFVKVIRDLAADQQRAHPLFFDLLEAAPDAMVIIGPDGRVTLVNGQTDRMFGYPREELVGSEIEILVPERFRAKHIDHRANFFANPMLRPMGQGLDLHGLRKDGTEFPVDISMSPLRIEHTLYVSASIRDVTERREQENKLRRQHAELIEAKLELERLARLDVLTGLVSHAETISRLEAALDDRRMPGTLLGVLFCDIDRFKAINDTWGHPAGDLVLSTVGERIRDCVRDDDTVGRVGGDEMLILLPGVHSIEEVVAIGHKIRRSVAAPIDHQGQIINMTLSIGATLARPGESVSDMTARADAAMYMAKQAGRNAVTAV
ncbi:MAG: diguanylate cyclase [Mycobacterium sp.]